MKSKKTLLILVLVVGALYGVLHFTSEKPPVEDSAEISALDGRSLRECKFFRWQFKNPSETPFEIARLPDGSFQLSEPLVDRASSAYVRQIINAWDSANLLATDYKNEADDNKETGLDLPVMTFAAEWPDGHRIEYEIGKPGPLGEDRFLLRDGLVWSGGQGLYESMRVNLGDLRDRQVFQGREVTCRSLRITGNTTSTGRREEIALGRVDNEWWLKAPVDGRADPRIAKQFVTAVLALRADTFLPGMIRIPEREPDVVVVAASSRGEERLEMWIENGAAFGQLPGRDSWFQCEPRTFEAVFDNAADRLRARILLAIDDIAASVAGIVMDPGQGRGDRVHLVRDSVASDWRLTEPVEYAVHATRAAETVQAINNLRAVEFIDDVDVDDERAGLGPGRLTLSVREFEQRAALTLWLGNEVERPNGRFRYACRADEPGTIVLVPSPPVERLRRTWPEYCIRDVLKVTVPIGQVEIVRPAVEGGEETLLYEFARDPDAPRRWLLEGELERTEAELREIGEFFTDVLVDLVGKQVVDLRTGDTGGRGDEFGAPDYLLKVCRRGGDVLQTVRIWDRDGSPVVMQPTARANVGFEVGVTASRQLRMLWK